MWQGPTKSTKVELGDSLFSMSDIHQGDCVALSREAVVELFGYLKIGRSDLFFARVADDVEWKVMGTHPLAGSYHSKSDFLTHTFQRLDRVLKEGVGSGQ
jgi:ketosteroid isomerase-like protein